MGVEEGVPVAVRVGRGVCRSLRGLRQACRAVGSVTRGSRGARGRLQCARGAGKTELSGRDWWAALDGQARDQSRLSESDRAARRDSGNAGAAPWSTFRQRRRRARAGAGPCCASRPLLQAGWSVLAEAWRTRPEVTRQLRRRQWRQRSCQSLNCP